MNKKESSKEINKQEPKADSNLRIRACVDLNLRLHYVAETDLNLVVNAILKEFGWREDESSLDILEWYVKIFGYNEFMRVYFDVSEKVTGKRDTRFPIRNPAGYFRAQLSQKLGPLPAALQRKLAMKQHMKQQPKEHDHGLQDPSTMSPVY